MTHKLRLERQLFGYHDAPADGNGGGGGGDTKTEAELEAERIAAEAAQDAIDYPGKTPEEIAALKQAKADEEANKNKGKTFTQKELDEIIAARLKRERDAAEKKAAEKAGEFEKLYNEVNPKFEALNAEVETLREIVNSNIDQIIKDWDADLKSQDPGKEDLKARQAWVEKSSKLAARLAGNKQPVDGEPGTNKNGSKKLPISGSAYMQKAYQKPVIPGQK